MRRLALGLLATLPFAAAAPAHADLGSLKAACAPKTAPESPTLKYVFCDDGVPDQGGRTANPTAAKAVAVPASYRWPDPVPAGVADPTVTGLPPAERDPGCTKVGGSAPSAADPTRCTVALDIDVTMPAGPAPPGGYPLVALMHGCCSGNKGSWEDTKVDGSGERWHYNNAWFASRGYVVLTYTARGFVTGQNRGSTGETQIDSLQYEMNDLQSLVAQLVDDPFFKVDPQRIVATGGSYGGGFSWLALVDPHWRTPGGKDVRLAAVAPKYGWTDLAHSLVPTGNHFYDAGRPPATDGSDSGYDLDDRRNTTAGVPIRSIISALFLAGTTGVPPGNHATFPQAVTDAFTCTQTIYPPDPSPICGAFLGIVVPDFIRYRSAYYWQPFFDRIRTDPGWRVPVFSAGTHTDPLFPPYEHRRMAERLQAIVPGYPIREYYGDYQHFVQNKAKEWGDVCGADRHVCRFADYPGGDLNAVPAGRQRVGATTMLNQFVDHYARPPANAGQGAPPFDVTASLQVCPQNAGGGQPADEPGPRFTAGSYDALTEGLLPLSFAGTQTTTSKVPGNERAVRQDPVANLAANGGRCPTERGPAPPGVAQYESPALPSAVTMLGGGIVRAPYVATGSASGLQLNAKLYDVFPDGTQVLVDRAAKRLPEGGPRGEAVYQLRGNGWRFERGHRVRLELLQDDDPHLKSSDIPSSLTLSGVRLILPVRETTFGRGGLAAVAGGDGGAVTARDASAPRVRLRTPRLASDDTSTRRFAVRWSGADIGSGMRGFDLQIRRYGARRWRTLLRNTRRTQTTYTGIFGRTYRFRLRARDRAGNASRWSSDETIVPTTERTRGARYRGPWRARQVRGSFGARVISCRGRRCRLTYRYRGASVYVLGRKGPGGGRVRITVDGRGRTVDLRSRSRRRQRRVLLSARRRSGRHVVRIRVLRGPVTLDGFAIRHKR